ncbi:hypothetical protein BLAT2472_50019 [Burkholderia latens]
MTVVSNQKIGVCNLLCRFCDPPFALAGALSGTFFGAYFGALPMRSPVRAFGRALRQPRCRPAAASHREAPTRRLLRRTGRRARRLAESSRLR